MNKEITTFTKDDMVYSVELIERNHNVVCVIPTITISTSILPPQMFQVVLEHILSLNRDYIGSIYFENVRFKYKFLSFQLFGHIRAALKEELRKPIKIDVLKGGGDDYRWVESGFLPRFPDNIETELGNIERKIKKMYMAFRKGKVKNTPYIMSEEYDVKYNYFFDADATFIKPVFDDIYVNTEHPEGIDNEESKLLLGKFGSLGVKLKFI